jgi:hypothetical protein
MRIAIAALLLLMILAGGRTITTSGTHVVPRPVRPIPSPVQHPAHRLPDECASDYVCGRCPNGDRWSYLDDGSANAEWAKQNNVIFDTRKPCG